MTDRPSRGAAVSLVGAAALALSLGLVAAAFGAVLWRAEEFGELSVADWAAVRFTLVQALLSAALSALLAIPVARALARRRFPGRRLLLFAFGAPFILPVIVAVMGLVALFGRAGFLNAVLTAAGLPPIQIYGLQGVVVAHVFLNLPLAVRMLLSGWAAIPAERLRMAAALGFSARDTARWIERPMLRATLPGAALAIFLICLTSFTVALILGGGPRATTVELAIYQAFRMEFDLAHAATLAAVQMAISVGAAALSFAISAPPSHGAGLDRVVRRWDVDGAIPRVTDGLALTLAALFLLLPVLLVVADGLPGVMRLPASVWPAAIRSVLVAIGAAALSVPGALAIGLWITALPVARGAVLEPLGMLSLTVSPLVIGTGFFLLLRSITDPVGWALMMTMLANALTALPFALRLLLPGLRDIRASYGRLADSLGLRGLAALRLLVLPRLRQPLWFATGLCAAFSMGDLGVVALFADPERATLPMKVYALMAAYRTGQAAAAALLLAGLSFGLFWIFDRWGHRDADA